MKNENHVVVGRTGRKKILVALLSGFLALGGLVSAFGFTGTAYALPLGGIGDFYVEFDELNGEGFQLMPQMGETGESDAEPMVRNVIDEVEIDNLHIFKDLQIPGTEQWVRFHIEADGKTNISGLIQDARFIDANLSFDNLAIEQQNTDDFSENWSQNADTITITDATLVTDYLFQEVVSLEEAKISTEMIDEPLITDDGN
ncbi:DUF6230 family protein [Lentibacillus sp. CBA3610]|uniref:DUF6230 family protein n=1 Tax=Lentibacillus sp. CBA3610 TaxID=2518176 RepID=UPI00159545A1|nr:DUF6230 family protein [Lentibacillus sp. CBA3610]QKY68761.1 hypothetical protein Len3610_03220 [Lentibacillus sp. CBA3610]